MLLHLVLFPSGTQVTDQQRENSFFFRFTRQTSVLVIMKIAFFYSQSSWSSDSHVLYLGVRYSCMQTNRMNMEACANACRLWFQVIYPHTLSHTITIAFLSNSVLLYFFIFARKSDCFLCFLHPLPCCACSRAWEKLRLFGCLSSPLLLYPANYCLTLCQDSRQVHTKLSCHCMQSDSHWLSVSASYFPVYLLMLMARGLLYSSTRHLFITPVNLAMLAIPLPSTGIALSHCVAAE